MALDIDAIFNVDLNLDSENYADAYYHISVLRDLEVISQEQFNLIDNFLDEKQKERYCEVTEKVFNPLKDLSPEELEEYYKKLPF